MPRFGPFIHQVYIADGFADDCDELVHRCLKAQNFDFQVFCRIWKELKMGCVYGGRVLGAEIAELSEELIHVGKHYMLKNTSNFEESVIGVFIVYALLNLQPYQGFAPLRVVPDDLPAINRIEHVARRDKRYDVLYALGSVLIKGPVEYHATEREYGMDLPVRKYLEGFTSIDKLGLRPKGVFRRQNEELDLLNDLDSITQKYMQAKMAISDKAQFDRNLKYINPTLGSELESSLKKLISGIHEDKYGESSLYDVDKISMSRRAIKDKAMKGDVKPVRHLEKLTNKKTGNATSTVTSDSPRKGKGRASSKKTTVVTRKNKKEKYAEAIASRKRRIPISPRALKKIRNNNDDDDDDEDEDDDVIAVSDDVESGKNVDNEPIENNKDVKIVSSVVTETVGIDAKETEKAANDVGANYDDNEQELDIQIDTLPVLIRTEDQGQLFEIEIIDQKRPEPQPEVKPKKTPVKKPPMKKYKRKKSVLETINSTPDMSIKKIVEEESAEPVASTYANELAKITEIVDSNEEIDAAIKKSVRESRGLGIPSTKVEKRDFKRGHVHSKFKRLGMLHVANFEAPDDIVSKKVEDKKTKTPKTNV